MALMAGGASSGGSATPLRSTSALMSASSELVVESGSGAAVGAPACGISSVFGCGCGSAGALAGCGLRFFAAGASGFDCCGSCALGAQRQPAIEACAGQDDAC